MKKATAAGRFIPLGTAYIGLHSAARVYAHPPFVTTTAGAPGTEMATETGAGSALFPQ